MATATKPETPKGADAPKPETPERDPDGPERDPAEKLREELEREQPESGDKHAPYGREPGGGALEKPPSPTHVMFLADGSKVGTRNPASTVHNGVPVTAVVELTDNQL